MSIDDRTVKDSSLWKDANSHAAIDRVDSTIRVGIVRNTDTSGGGKLKYVVEVFLKGNVVLLPCDLMTRFGGAHNYEEYGLRPYNKMNTKIPVDPSPYTAYELRAGDEVVVACIGGMFRRGVILGGLTHPSRKSKFASGDIAYASQFNGIETKITADGEYRITNLGQELVPLDLAVPGTPIPASTGNPMAGNFFSMKPNGDFELSDAGMQGIKIEKTAQTITITSGKCVLTIGTTKQKFGVDNISTEFNSSLDFKVATKQVDIKADVSCKIKALKVAIGNDAVELVDALIQLIDMIGTVVVTSPVGPCNPVNTAPTWAQVILLKGKLTGLKA